MRAVIQEKNWKIYAPETGLRRLLSRDLGISPITAQVLINRGIRSADEAKRFVSNDIETLHDPFLMEGMEKARQRILFAIAKKQNITIYGDYDADGICATALLIFAFGKIGGQCRYYLPNRADDGYGLNKDAVRKCKEFGTDLLITVDCGICGAEEVSYARSLGMDVIVTDHHSPVKDIPVCSAVLNPKLAGSRYPYRDLSGTGVAYKLAEAVIGDSAKEYLDLVAVGTIADIVPLTGENRLLAYHGLVALERTKNTGLVSLKTISGLEDSRVDASSVSFRLAPRINAAGRLDTCETAVKLLLAQTPLEADRLSDILNMNNRDRQKIERKVFNEAVAQIEAKFSFSKDKVIVLDGEDWPVGVIGIVAGKMARLYNRPCIIISVENKIGKGSARSVKPFHLLDALTFCGDHLREFGGHEQAAGLSLEEALIPSLREKINAYADTVLSEADFTPGIEIDSEADFKDISFDLINELESLEPFGNGNPKPCLMSRDVRVCREPRIVGNGHLKFCVKSNNMVFEAVGFDMADYISLLEDSPDSIDIVYRPQINKWAGREIIQLQILDIKSKEL